MDWFITILYFLYLFSVLDVSATYKKLPVAVGDPIIRVRIGQSLPHIEIAGTDLKRTMHFNNDTKKYHGIKKVVFNCVNPGLGQRKKNTPVLLASLSSHTNFLSFNESKYQGKIKVLTNINQQSCDVVNEISLESYISSLLAKEMNSKWPLEALKAQAVAARTYALHKMRSKQMSKILGHEAHYDLESSEKHQVGGSYFDITKKTLRAAAATFGVVLLTKKGKLTPTFFHAKCGGRTLRPDQVWDNHIDGYHGVLCPFCDQHGKKSWKQRLSFAKFSRFFVWYRKFKGKKSESFTIQSIANLKVVADNVLSNTIRIYLGEKVYIINKALLRRYFGRSTIPSNHFTLKFKRGIFYLSGNGLGHGVGMCQLGALDLAQKGWSYKKILAYYFTGHKLKKIY